MPSKSNWKKKTKDWLFQHFFFLLPDGVSLLSTTPARVGASPTDRKFFPPPLQRRSELTGIQRMRLHELWNTFYPVLLSTAKPKRRGYSSPCMKTFFLFRFSEMLIFFSSESRIEWAFVRVSMSEWGRAREVRNASSSLDWWTISPFSPFFSIFFSALATSTPTKEEGCRGGAQINSLPLFQAESAIPLDGLVRRPSSKVHLNADVSRGRKRKREPA